MDGSMYIQCTPRPPNLDPTHLCHINDLCTLLSDSVDACGYRKKKQKTTAAAAVQREEQLLMQHALEHMNMYES